MFGLLIEKSKTHEFEASDKGIMELPAVVPGSLVPALSTLTSLLRPRFMGYVENMIHNSIQPAINGLLP